MAFCLFSLMRFGCFQKKKEKAAQNGWFIMEKPIKIVICIRELEKFHPEL